MNIGFIGLGKLGYPVAKRLAQHHGVIGFDTNPEIKTGDVLVADSLALACLKAEVIFVAIQTPHQACYGGEIPAASRPPADFDYSYVKEVLRSINLLVKPNQLVALISTVLPGTIRTQLAPLITNSRFIYNPYLVAMGSVAEDMDQPEMVIIGTDTGLTPREEENIRRLLEVYEPVCPEAKRFIGTWEETEAFKVIYNVFISTKLAIVNMVQDISVKIGHMNSAKICDALASSTMRITGSRYMFPAMGDAGPCHPRDLIAMRYMAKNLNLGYDLFGAIVEAREAQARNLATFIVRESEGKPITILGKNYKPGVTYTDGSYSLLVGHWITEMTKQAPIYDVIPSEPCTILLAHPTQVAAGQLIIGSTIIDPWKKHPPINRIKVIHYGSTTVYDGNAGGSTGSIEIEKPG